MLTWMEKWKVGFGMMGEQGFESVHHNFNEIQKSYQNMPNPVERMKRVMFEHFIRISPSNVRLEPAIKRRKLNILHMRYIVWEVGPGNEEDLPQHAWVMSLRVHRP